MGLSKRSIKKANLSGEAVLDDMLKISFERFSTPCPAPSEEYNTLSGILTNNATESNIAINSLIFVADARFQLDNVTGRKDYRGWAGVVRELCYRKNGQIPRLFSPEHPEMQDLLARDVKGEIATTNPELELMGPEYAMSVVAGKLVIPASIESPVARVVQLPVTSRNAA